MFWVSIFLLAQLSETIEGLEAEEGVNQEKISTISPKLLGDTE